MGRGIDIAVLANQQHGRGRAQPLQEGQQLDMIGQTYFPIGGAQYIHFIEAE